MAKVEKNCSNKRPQAENSTRSCIQETCRTDNAHTRRLDQTTDKASILWTRSLCTRSTIGLKSNEASKVEHLDKAQGLRKVKAGQLVLVDLVTAVINQVVTGCMAHKCLDILIRRRKVGKLLKHSLRWRWNPGIDQRLRDVTGN